MREIKFRGRGAPRGKQWFYGELDTHTSGVCILDKNTLHTVISETVGQYTGLKDATGKEIYEGDVIKTREGDVGVIVWETELGGFRARLTDDSFYTLTALFASMFSVIGNVHDNPELLEATVGGRP